MMSHIKYEEDISMPSKVMAISIFKKPIILSASKFWCLFQKKGLAISYVTKFGRMFWVHVLMLITKYKEDSIMSPKGMANSIFKT